MNSTTLGGNFTWSYIVDLYVSAPAFSVSHRVRNTLSLLRPSPEVLHKSAQAVKAAGQLRTLAFPTTALVMLTLLSGPFVAGTLGKQWRKA